MQIKLADFLNSREKLIPVLLFALFLAVTIPGVNWGVPALWNPDELVWRVDNALGGELIFDETEPDFNYPSLPKYVMYGIGKIVYGMGYSESDFIIAARVFSATLGAAAAVLVYYLARAIGAEAATAGLAGLLYVASGVASANGRFAHNDMYLQLFAILCVFAAIKYQFTKARLWVYASFLCVGLAASSKYTGGSLLLLPLFVLFVMNWSRARSDWLQSVETFFIGVVLSFGGYVMGTPKAILWMAFYFKRVIPALLRYPLYGKDAGGVIGLFGQWSVLEAAVGGFAFCLFLAALAWFCMRLILKRMQKLPMEVNQSQAVPILLLTVLIFDLPFLDSVNYIPRYFIPFVPFLSILGALFVREVLQWTNDKGWKLLSSGLKIVLFIGICYSLLRLVSTALLFVNDARMPAGHYIASLPGQNKVLEYTLYPPIIDRGQFSKAHNYPIYFVKYPGDVVPSGGKVQYNQGEAGLLERQVDYLVIDTFTYARFSNKGICDSNPVECDFFRRLLAGQDSSYRLVKTFAYTLPPYMPQVSISAVNPEIRVYERAP